MTEEKYLAVQIVGHKPVYAFKNNDKGENPKAPDFNGDGVAVWVNTKKEKSENEL